MVLYKWLDKIGSTEWIEYGSVAVIVVFLIAYVFKPSWLFLVGVLLAVVVCWYRYDRQRNTLSGRNEELELRLRSLKPKPENFHMDVDLINFFYNIKEMRKYNSEAYDECLVAVDNMLKLMSEVRYGGIGRCRDKTDIMSDLMFKALNHLQSIIIRTPIDKPITMKHQRSMNALHVLLRRHLDKALERCHHDNTNEPISINTQPTYNLPGPRPDDTQRAEYSRWDVF